MKAFTNSFQAPQKSVKIKIKVSFFIRLRSGREGLKPEIKNEIKLVQATSLKITSIQSRFVTRVLKA